MAAPCALFASCCDYKPEQLVKQILGTSELTESSHVLEGVCANNWHINTKYYTADVQLCTIASRSIGNQQFADSVQAFIVYFDSNQVSSFDQVKMWLPYLKEIEPDVQILVCETCSHEHAVDRLMAQKWCIDNAFELVELVPEETSDGEEEDELMAETTGIKRIVQALQSHMWPNMVMKDNPDIRSPYFCQLMHEQRLQSQSTDTADVKVIPVEKDVCGSEDKESQHFTNTVTSTDDKSPQHKCLPSTDKTENLCNTHTDTTENSVVDSESTCDSAVGCDKQKDSSAADGCSKQTDGKSVKNKKKQKTEDKLDSLLPPDELALFEALGRDDPGGQSFEALFAQLSTMKEKAESLPLEQRKSYAEQIAVSFWKAVGGDEEELDGLSDSD